MIFNLYKVKVWEDDELIEKIGVVLGNNFSEAAEGLEGYYDFIEEINYISPVGDSLVWELDEAGFEIFEKLKSEAIW